MKTEFMNSITRTFHKVGFGLKKHSPEILVVGGVVGVVASTVMACKATTKLDTILEKTKDNVSKIHECAEHPELLPEPYTQEDAKKDLTITYAHAVVDIAKLYGPAVILGAVSIASILTGHNILRKRNFALAAAYATVDQGFKEYRGRVIERFGKELDRELKYNIKAQEVEEVVVNEDGTESTVTKTVETASVNFGSQYARFFDETCRAWERDAQLNRKRVSMIQDWANETLRSRGYLYLNEVYEAFGMGKTEDGHVVGWVYDPENPNHMGDNIVDFGIFDVHDERKRAFVNCYEKSVLIDPNVDGYIADHRFVLGSIF